jgi:uncharacterized membrane protein YozB (DUF420 family)
MSPADLPTVNAGLNATCTVLLVVGYIAIKRGQVTLHKSCMVAGLVVSAAFLASYLYYHFVERQGQSTPFTGPADVKVIYLAILFSHMILAAIATPLALYTAWQGYRDNLKRHVRLARWTLPIWLYVSITGVIVYWMLYRLYPPPTAAATMVGE